tara:strand:- start:221 stop:775 length:555 start_codon:yes stop_codon:yes gene_type:complete
MAYGGHPDHGLSGTSSGHEAGSGMESAYGGKAIGLPGGVEAGHNEMSAFLDLMQQRYGIESVANYMERFLYRYKEVEFPTAAQGFRDFNTSFQTTPQPGTPSVDAPTPELQMSGRLTHAQLAALDAAQASTQNFSSNTDFSFDQGWLDQMHEDANRVTPQVDPDGGGGERIKKKRGMIGRVSDI